MSVPEPLRAPLGRAVAGADDAANALIVLVLNSGSSSLKFGLYRVGAASIQMLFDGAAEAIGDDAGHFHAVVEDRADVRETGSLPNVATVLARIVRLLAEAALPMPQAVGHRIVHGGPKLRRHCRIDAAVLEQLERARIFAPLHAPAELALIGLAGAQFPQAIPIACFDTSFHARMPALARTLPIARAARRNGIERYGFHGLSCESIVATLGAALPPRLIIAHLGNGASITAVRYGRSIDTSMGLTPCGGIVMGTRSGDLDPGVLIHLLREAGCDAARLETLLDHQSGLLGISGRSSDLRELHAAAVFDDDARLAIAMFCRSASKQIAAMIAVLDGVDGIVFTGGIGENDAEVRAAICADLGWLGVRLDPVRNRAANNPLSDSASRCGVLVLLAQEDRQIARHAWNLRQNAGNEPAA